MSTLFKVLDKANKTVKMVPAESRAALVKELLEKHYEISHPTKADLIAAMLPAKADAVP